MQLPYDQFKQQYKRAVFNVIARNHDDHVKNFSFLMDKKGTWKISPAYDITYSYKPGGIWTDVHQSSINGKYTDFTKVDLVEFGKKFGIKKSKQIVEEVIHSVSEWRSIAKETEVPNDRISQIEKNLRLNIR